MNSTPQVDATIPIGDTDRAVSKGQYGARPTITAVRLRKFLDYDPETGVFRRKISQRTDRSGCVAGGIGVLGYVQIHFDKKLYLAHRLAWLYMTGKWPSKEIDHADGCRSNNRWDNLRVATRTQNNANSKTRKNNSSGMKGASYHRKSRCWCSKIQVNGKSISLGYFDTAEDAHAAYAVAARKYFGEFARSV